MREGLAVRCQVSDIKDVEEGRFRQMIVSSAMTIR